jgi:hypothetical protein
MVHFELSQGYLSGEGPMVRHCDDPMRSIGRPTHLPPQATAMAGANALGGASRAGLHRRQEPSTRRRASRAVGGHV